MLCGLVESDALYALDLREGVGKRRRLVIGDVRRHDARRAVSRELVLHDVQRELGLRVVRQEGGKLVFHVHPIPRKCGENEQNDRDEEKQIAPVHNGRRKL